MLTVEEARSRLLALAGRCPAVEVDLNDGAGLVLAAEVTAPRNLPGFDNSAMDGYAVRVADLAGASPDRPARLRVVGEGAAGSGFGGRVDPGTAGRIMTGAPMPAGAEAVLAGGGAELEGGVLLARAE